MTRKDYVLIAATIRQEIDSVESDVLLGEADRTLVTWHLKQAALRMARALVLGNHGNFDYDRFVTAATGD